MREPHRELWPRTKKRIRADVDEELAFHIEQRIAELVAGGMNATDAREATLRKFGPVAETRAVCIDSDQRREARMTRRNEWQDIVQDMRIACRQLIRRPAFAATTILTLALGIGAATTVFSVTDRVLLRPLPYADASRILTVWGTNRRTGANTEQITPGEFVAWSEASRRTSAWGLAEPSGFDLTGDEHPQPVSAWKVTQGFFTALGVRPIAGAMLSHEDYKASEIGAVMISYDMWKKRYAGDPAVAGRLIQLDGHGVTIRGVLPPGIAYPEPADIWAPRRISAEERTDFDSDYMIAIARLSLGATESDARTEIERISAQIARAPKGDPNRGVHAVPLPSQVLGPARPALGMLSAAVALLLLIACSNVAALLIARNQDRARELAVRAALGGSRRRLLRHLLTESAVLVLIAGAAGIGLAWAGAHVVSALAPAELPRAGELRVDPRVIAFAIVMTLLTFLLSGMPAAFRGTRVSLANTLRSGSRSVHGGSDARRYRHVLVTLQLALALVLLVGAGLLGRSFLALVSSDIGFDPSNRATLQVFLWDRNPTNEQRVARISEIETLLRAVRGVDAVGATTAAPFHPHRIATQSAVRVIGGDSRSEESPAIGLIITPGYPRAMGTALVRGRGFANDDRASTPRVALLNEAAAKLYFPGQDPLGRHVSFGVMAKAEERVVVGILHDSRTVALESSVRPEVYIPFAQSGDGSVTFVIHTATDARALMPQLRAALWQADAKQSIYYEATLQELLSGTLAARRFYMDVIAVFSVVAITLAAVGLYGLISFSTRQRKSEIGVRLALGARAQQVLVMLVHEGIMLAVPGLVIGTAAALWLTRFLRAMLYGIPAHDPKTYAVACALLLLLAAIGAFVPARRAATADPVEAIRGD